MDSPLVGTCTYKGCNSSTKEGKPFCIDHVTELGYPKEVSDHWDRIVAERDAINEACRARRPSPVRPNWLIVEECLLVVSACELVCLAGRISRDMGIELDAVEDLCRAAGLTKKSAERTTSYDPLEAVDRINRILEGRRRKVERAEKAKETARTRAALRRMIRGE